MMKTYKIVVLGNSAVGKTSILAQMIYHEFDYATPASVGVSYVQKIMDVPGCEEKAELRFFDTAGQERYASLARLNFKGSKAAMIVYDITSKESFEGVKRWIQNVKQDGPKDIILYVLGNKTDLLDKQLVSLKEAKELAKDEGTKLKLVSAKNGEGIKDFLDELVRDLHEAKEGDKGDGPAQSSIVTITSTSGTSQKKKKCC